MTEALALEYIPRRMEELNYGRDYYIRFRHFVLQPGEMQELTAFNEFYILIAEVDNISIRSDFGMFDLSFDKINEQQYEHQGQISIHNYSTAVNHLRFIQVIPKYKPKQQ